MRLLLTRAAEDSARTREKLEAMGHHIVVSPVIEFVGTDATWPKGVVDAVVATSAHAFEAKLDGLSPETQRLLPLFVVGSRTAGAARTRGFLGATTVDKNAGSLAAAIEGLRDRPKQIVYLAGRDRKPDLESALDAMNQSFETIEVYAAQPVDEPTPEAIKALRDGVIDGVLHFSRRSATLFLAASDKAGLDIGRPTNFCLSEDVASPLRDAGCTAVKVSAEPNEADLLALVGKGS